MVLEMAEVLVGDQEEAAEALVDPEAVALEEEVRVVELLVEVDHQVVPAEAHQAAVVAPVVGMAVAQILAEEDLRVAAVHPAVRAVAEELQVVATERQPAQLRVFPLYLPMSTHSLLVPVERMSQIFRRSW